MISQEDFDNAISSFKQLESRSNFFELAEGLLKKRLETEAYLLILATWNFAIFRYAVKTFDIENFKQALNNISSNFSKFDGEDFKNIDFEKYENDVKVIYTTLSEISGINHTGAPKLMHLRVPNVFVMWDSYIRGEKSERHYKDLDICKQGNYIHDKEKYEKDANSYIKFLRDMKSKFCHLNVTMPNKTMAKAIDEYN
jgi:hypothetical protein